MKGAIFNDINTKPAILKFHYIYTKLIMISNKCQENALFCLPHFFHITRKCNECNPYQVFRFDTILQPLAPALTMNLPVANCNVNIMYVKQAVFTVLLIMVFRQWMILLILITVCRFKISCLDMRDSF